MTYMIFYHEIVDSLIEVVKRKIATTEVIDLSKNDLPL